MKQQHGLLDAVLAVGFIVFAITLVAFCTFWLVLAAWRAFA